MIGEHPRPRYLGKPTQCCCHRRSAPGAWRRASHTPLRVEKRLRPVVPFRRNRVGPLPRNRVVPLPRNQEGPFTRNPAAGLGDVRYPRKISFGRNLYLLVMPKGGRYWRYCYRYGGKRKTLALGTYPDVPMARARSRHQAARTLLAAGVDPSLKKSELRYVG